MSSVDLHDVSCHKSELPKAKNFEGHNDPQGLSFEGHFDPQVPIFEGHFKNVNFYS